MKNENSMNSLFKNLTLRMEGFTYLVPVPVAIYFAFTTVSKHLDTTHKIMAFLVSCIFAATVNAASAIIWRYFRLRKLAANFESGKIPAIEAKLKLMAQPGLESFVIIFRWLIGIFQGFACGYYFADVPLSAAVEIGIVLFALIAPIDSARVYLISEATIAAFLEHPPFEKVVVPESQIGFHPYWKKIVWTLLSIVWLPYVMLGYLMYAERSGMVSVSSPLTHIVIMGSLMILPITVMSVYLGRGVSRGLRTAHGQLKRVSDGDFDVTATAISRDEFGAQAYAMNDVITRLRHMYLDIKELNSTLEGKVETRTHELNETLEEVRAIKRQQDGDYFLTSLLLQPLNGNFARSDRIELVSLVRQKKTFDFKNRHSELGGDLVAAYNLLLDDKPFIAFVNGDCMGKSMQGAGGAIVLGTVFKSFVNRTRVQPAMAGKFPERWLKECALELHEVFAGFDGTMSTSAVIGLVDEDTGVLYMVNAEHPWSVLYRDGKAIFLEDRSTMYKIGFPGAEKNLSISAVRLLPGDAIICGSDGRDDLILGQNENSREINADEAKFLVAVEEGEGNLESIFSRLKMCGELMDDLSLVRIAFKPSISSGTPEAVPSEALASARSFSQAGEIGKAIALLNDHVQGVGYPARVTIRALAQLHIQDRNYAEAAQICAKGYSLYPEDNTLLFYAAYAAYRTGKINLASDMAESLRLRNRNHMENLTLLARIYAHSNRDRARMFLEEGLALQPDHPKLTRLARKLGLVPAET